MMEKSANHYLFEALLVLKANISYVFIPTILTSSFYLSQFVSEDFKFAFISTIGFTLFIVMPLFYGQFIEIINTGQKDTWRNVFKHYWLKVFLVILILRAPTIVFGYLSPNMFTVKEILSFIIDVASIYILPLVLLKKEVLGSIKLGIKCLLGNLKFSLPILLVLTFSFLFPILVTVVIKYIHVQFLSYLFSLILIFLSTFFDFVIFISASLILKEKLLMAF